MSELYEQNGQIITVSSGSEESKIEVLALDKLGAGGAHHLYQIWRAQDRVLLCSIAFQNGTIAEAGCNGITNESLLAVVIDRLEKFQAGPFACVENENALDAARSAMRHLMARTVRRQAQNIEGKPVEVQNGIQ